MNCEMCGIGIGWRHGNAKRCLKCASEQRCLQAQQARARNSSRKRRDAETPSQRTSQSLRRLLATCRWCRWRWRTCSPTRATLGTSPGGGQCGRREPVCVRLAAANSHRPRARHRGWSHAPPSGPTAWLDPCAHGDYSGQARESLPPADNRSGEFSTWDLDVLPGELAALPSAQLEALPALDFTAMMPPIDGQTDPDEIPKAPKPRTKLGDVWTLGEHRLMCGDSTDAACVHNLMDGAEADLLFTSPPYLNQRAYTTGGIDDWDALMRGVFSHATMTASGQLLVNLGMIHKDKEWLPYWGRLDRVDARA